MSTSPSAPDLPPLSVRVGRRVVQLPALLALTIVWVLLFGELSVDTVVSGLLVGLAVTLVFPLPPLDSGFRLHPVGTAVFLFRFVVDMVLASARVVTQAFAFGRPLHSSIIAVPLRTRSDLLFTFTAICVSVIPGSVIVEVRSGTFTLFAHVLGAGADDVEQARRDLLALEERIVRAFGKRTEIERLESSGSLS
ncbi:Na+/H+ antiporter subunit E [Actinorugispora endophytica]|uniref:Multisubunit sodium/proton antiporter MrpE subunit n=1 Tax=Actinorugispora endophytica TaxID=1605990 RepID=A0A4R6UUN8_9ACTN|nr:Na+/H+ antiporter subunit E [Actinorugispora endophytica]TDQ49976.1 multisubunit sodium/proton antiporter MrpE subunit [Actinorugispora endophytica]